MNLRSICRKGTEKTDLYATNDDFRQLFRDNEPSLYLLSYLLTSDSEKAQACFVSGLEDCMDGNSVFAEWAASWARRTIVQNAIRLMTPTANKADEPNLSGVSNFVVDHALLAQDVCAFAGVLSLQTFERFVYVLSVLERYSDQECSRMLGTLVSEIRQARVRAIQQVADYNEKHYPGEAGTEVLSSHSGSELATARRS